MILQVFLSTSLYNREVGKNICDLKRPSLKRCVKTRTLAWVLHFSPLEHLEPIELLEHTHAVTLKNFKPLNS